MTQATENWDYLFDLDKQPKKVSYKVDLRKSYTLALSAWEKEVEVVNKRGTKSTLPKNALNTMKVEIHQQDNFTVAILTHKNKNLGVGVAKRLPTDKPNEPVGSRIAVVRALRDYLDK